MPSKSLGCDYLSYPESRTGNLSLHIRWPYEISESLTVIIISEYPRILSINGNRKPEWLAD